MKVAPTHDDLEGIMEIGDNAVAAHENQPPDGGANFKQQDAELVYYDRGAFDG